MHDQPDDTADAIPAEPEDDTCESGRSTISQSSDTDEEHTEEPAAETAETAAGVSEPPSSRKKKRIIVVRRPAGAESEIPLGEPSPDEPPSPSGAA
jgi:hypothetical protein